MTGDLLVLSVVIPAYNESERIVPGLEQIREYAAAAAWPIEVIVVDDGSTDGTAERVEEMDPGKLRLRVVRNNRNRGKGYSVRRGMLEASGDLLMMTDADASTHIREVDKLLCWLDDGYDVAIGSRYMPDSVLAPPQPWRRRLLAVVFRALRKMLMLPGIRDTQCGFKCFRRQVGRDIFSRLKTEDFAFDCEVLGLAKALGYRIREVGVLWRNDADSRVQPLSDPLRMLASLFRIRRQFCHPRTENRSCSQGDRGIARASQSSASSPLREANPPGTWT